MQGNMLAILYKKLKEITGHQQVNTLGQAACRNHLEHSIGVRKAKIIYLPGSPIS